MITAALGVSALAGAYLGVVWGDSEPVAVDAGAYYRFVSVRSGNALDVAGADGVRIQQEQRSPDAASQQWRLKPVDGGYHQLVNNNSAMTCRTSSRSSSDNPARTCRARARIPATSHTGSWTSPRCSRGCWTCSSPVTGSACSPFRTRKRSSILCAGPAVHTLHELRHHLLDIRRRFDRSPR
ncbi:RICIN domain-containing protein [Lentzea chajnantorensis]